MKSPLFSINMSDKTNILLAEDSAVFAMGLKLILSAEADMAQIDTATDPLSAMAYLREHPETNLVIIDISLTREQDGLTLLERIKETFPAMRTMVLSQHKTPAYMQQAISYGANAYLAKDSSPEEITRAVKRVAAGYSFFFGETIPDEMRSEILRPKKIGENTAFSKLSTKEREALQLITYGYSNRQIATAMQVATTTIDTYKERIKNKLGFDTIVECVAYAVAEHLVETR